MEARNYSIAQLRLMAEESDKMHARRLNEQLRVAHLAAAAAWSANGANELERMSRKLEETSTT